MMKPILSVAALLALSLAVTSCAPADATLPPTVTPPGAAAVSSKLGRAAAPQIAQGDQDALAAGNRDFAADLYRQLRAQDGNLFLSPYSISLALAMTYAGAQGATAGQMASTLHFTLPADRLHPAFNALDQSLAALGRAASSATPTPFAPTGQGFQLDIANAIWGQQGHTFLPTYLDRLAQNYGAGLRLADFAGQPEVSRQAINAWVSQQTQEKIQDLFPQGAIDASTRLALVNAIYFKASWENPFDENGTKNGVFHLKDGGQVDAPMMTSNSTASLYEQEAGFQAVGLPYFDEKAMLVVVMPAAGQFDTFEAGLTADRMQSIVSGLKPVHDAHLTLPRFKVESSFSLADTLAKMGMPDAFGAQADFSAMDGQKDLFISAVVHKATISVDEKGTEAAAATGVAVQAMAMMNSPTVTIDRPFFLMIVEPASGTILFTGRVLDPTK
jgi:serpin B